VPKITAFSAPPLGKPHSWTVMIPTVGSRLNGLGKQNIFFMHVQKKEAIMIRYKILIPHFHPFISQIIGTRIKKK
jgi:hypothetical protein